MTLNNEDYSALFKLVQDWRYNYPTLKVMFDTVFDTFATNKHPRPTFSSMDFSAYHKAVDEYGAAGVARNTYAGAVVIVIGRALQSFRSNIAANHDEWKRSEPIFGGCSLGQLLEASGNNVRHHDEWLTTRFPTDQQLPSIKVLSWAFQEPILSDGRDHKFAREISPEASQLVSGGDFLRLERAAFTFAKNLLGHRQRRIPTLFR